MGDFEIFVAIIKGYCAINILILPKQFENGGWLVGILAVNFACMFVMMCALKLIECGIKLQVYDYSEIALRALGPTGKSIFDICLTLV